MRYAVPLTLLAMASLLARPVGATEYISDPDTDPHVPVVVTDLFVLGEEPLDPGIAEADLEYARDMRRHHQGALDMSARYLDDPRGTHPVLRRLSHAIMANQEFEITVLDTVHDHVQAGPREVLRLGGLRLTALDRGIDGLEHALEFIEVPAPSFIDVQLSQAEVSEYDVQFARPMIRHHAAAIEMADSYDAGAPDVNRILGSLNIDIRVEQAYEIGLLRQVLADYPGDPAAVPDDPAMMEIMERSMSGMGGT